MSDQYHTKNFDIVRYLEDRQVWYTYSGKNTGHGWIGTQCVYCDDESDHLGINLETKAVKCWKCGSHDEGGGTLITYIQTLEGCDLRSARQRLREYYDPLYTPPEKQKPARDPGGKVLPDGILKEFPRLHLRYLRDRGFDPAIVIPEWDLYAVWLTGPWRFRILAPIVIGKQVVSFVTRDITNKSDQRYKNCPDYRALVPRHELLYGVDKVRNNVLIVEGLMDTWRIGPGTVATLGTEVSDGQLLRLLNMKAKHYYVMFDSPEKDPEALPKAKRLASSISMAGRAVEVLELGIGDPGDLPQEEAMKLREELKL
jgi:hypothetical protein